MKPNLICYYKKILKDIFISKLNFNNIYYMPTISHLKLTMTFNNQMFLEDINIVKSMLLLELIGLQKCYFRKIRSIFRNKKQFLIFSFEVKLRNLNMYNLLHLLVKDTIPQISKHYIFINQELNNINIYEFGFSNMNVFSSIDENFIKWPYSMNVQIFPGNINNNYYSKLLLQALKLPIKS
jgi:ribosomal protein L5